MKLTDIITKAQVLSGVGVFEGNAVDENLMATSLSVFHDALNDINNDPRVTLVQKELNYQTYTEEAKIQNPSPPSGGGWINIVPPEDEPINPPEEIVSLFPNIETLPFPTSNEYPLPKDCRRVLKVMSRQAELRKTDFAEIARNRNSYKGLLNMYSVNNNAIQLVRTAPAILIYAMEFPEFMPQDEVTIPNFALSYLINKTAYHISLTYPELGSQERCLKMTEMAYNSLLANLAVNAGEKYINPFVPMNRLEMAGNGGEF